MPGIMDPKAALPAGEPLMLQDVSTSAPFSQDQAAVEALAGESEVKPLRPPKERHPVATEIDPQQVLNTWTPAAGPAASEPTSAASPAAPAAASISATAIFPGGTDNRTTVPPDTAGAVGPTHVFNPLNNNVCIFDRNGHQVSAPVPLNDFWSHLGLHGHTFDPRAIFDPFGGRFIFVTMADANLPTSSLLVAVSQTSDPTKEWVSHAIRVEDAAQGPVWFDFPSVGFSSDKITIAINMYTRADNALAGAAVYAIDKQSLYNAPHHALVQRFILQNQGATHVPAVTYDAAFADQFLLSRWSGNLNNQGYLVVYSLSGNVAAGNATLTRVGFITAPHTWDAFPPDDLGQQSGSSQRLSVGDDRMLSVSWRNGKLYCAHAIMLPTGDPSRSAVQWWEIETGTWKVLNIGRIDDPTGATCYSAPSLAVNRNEDVLIGHARFSADMFGSGAFSFRPAGGALQTPTIFAPGKNTYQKPFMFAGTSNRWGDYSHTQVDPNDRDFWTVQQFAGTDADTWATMWARIPGPPVQVAGAGQTSGGTS